MAEVMAETRLHESARLRVERLAGRAQRFVDDGRHLRRFRLTRTASLQTLLATRFTLSPGDGVLAARTLALQLARPGCLLLHRGSNVSLAIGLCAHRSLQTPFSCVDSFA
jgi:hypothetical protein